MARRSGDKWYVAGINATDQTIKRTLTLPMLSAGEAQLYMNDQLKPVKLNKKKALKVEIPTNGGLVVVQ